MREQTKNRLWGVGALLLGLIGLAYTGWITVLAANQDSWLPADAVVTQSKTTHSSKEAGFSPQISPHFRYRYEVAGKTHSATRYSFWSVGGDKFEATQLFQPGERIRTYHHPRHREIAVVEIVRPSVFVWLIAVVALVIAVRGAVMVKTGKAAG